MKLTKSRKTDFVEALYRYQMSGLSSCLKLHSSFCVSVDFFPPDFITVDQVPQLGLPTQRDGRDFSVFKSREIVAIETIQTIKHSALTMRASSSHFPT